MASLDCWRMSRRGDPPRCDGDTWIFLSRGGLRTVGAISRRRWCVSAGRRMQLPRLGTAAMRAPSTISRETRQSGDADDRLRPYAEQSARLRGVQASQAGLLWTRGWLRRSSSLGEVEPGAGRARTGVAVRRTAGALASQGAICQALYDTSVSVTRPVRRRWLCGVQHRQRLAAMPDDRRATGRGRRLRSGRSLRGRSHHGAPGATQRSGFPTVAVTSRRSADR